MWEHHTYVSRAESKRRQQQRQKSAQIMVVLIVAGLFVFAMALMQGCTPAPLDTDDTVIPTGDSSWPFVSPPTMRLPETVDLPDTQEIEQIPDTHNGPEDEWYQDQAMAICDSYPNTKTMEMRCDDFAAAINLYFWMVDNTPDDGRALGAAWANVNRNAVLIYGQEQAERQSSPHTRPERTRDV